MFVMECTINQPKDMMVPWLAVQGAGQNINQAGQQITRKNLDIQPTIEVKPGERVNIFATKDIILPPYRERLAQGSP